MKIKTKAIIVIPIIFVILLLTIVFSGGPSGFINSLKPAPNPNSSKFASKRNAAVDEINASFKKLEANLNFTSYTSSVHDRCYKGQNNWKVHDGFAHQCTYRLTKFYGFDGDFREHVNNLEAVLTSNGWHAEWHGSLKEDIDTYYRVYGGPDNPTISYPNFPQGRPLCELRPTEYTQSSNMTKVLEIRFGERNRIDEQCTRGENIFDAIQRVSRDTLFGTYDNNRGLVSGQLAVDQVTKEKRFVVVIPIQQTYFEN